MPDLQKSQHLELEPIVGRGHKIHARKANATGGLAGFAHPNQRPLELLNLALAYGTQRAMNNLSTIERWVERLNAGDVAGCVESYAPDATLQVMFTDPVVGRDGIRAMFEAYFSAAPLHCIIKQLYAAEGDRVVLEWQDKVGLFGINVYEFSDGLISAQRNYFDSASFQRLNDLPAS